MQEEVALYKDQIAEAVAMGDDELMENSSLVKNLVMQN